MQITIDTTDIESVATAIREGITTPDQLAYWDDQGEIVDGCYIPSGSPIYADDGNAEIEYASDVTPEQAA